MTSILTIVPVILMVIFSILLLVFIHELGHFWLARWYGIGVQKFSIGFGRPLLSYTSRKTGTQWCLSMIPLGGYVKFYDYTEEAPAGQIGFSEAPALAKVAVAAAGPLFNLLLAFIIILGINYQQGVHQPIIAKPLPASALFAAGITQQTAIQSISYGEKTHVVDSFEMLERHIFDALSNDQNFVLSDTQKQNYFVDAFKSMELVNLASSNSKNSNNANSFANATKSKNINQPKSPSSIYIFSEEKLGLSLPLIGQAIKTVQKNEAADFLGLKAGQKIITINGEPLDNQYIWRSYQSLPEFRLGILGANIADVADVAKFKHDSKEIIVDLNALKQKFVNSPLNQKNNQMKKELSEKTNISLDLGRNFIYGLSFQPIIAPNIKHTAILPVLQESLAELAQKTMQQLAGAANSIFGLRTEQMTSIVGVSQILGESAKISWVYFIDLLAILSIGLACINLLPIPLLDGWHILTGIIEAVLKKPIPESINQAFHRFGLMFLLFIFLSTLFQDLFKLAH